MAAPINGRRSACAITCLLAALLAGSSGRLGLAFAWYATHVNHRLAGRTPVFHTGIPWAFTFEQLAAVDLSGQRALVTGASSGLGYWTALHLARQGAHVTLACRSASRCDAAAAAILANHSIAQLETALVDTSSLRSARALAAAQLAAGAPLDMLVLNAGIAGDASALALTDDGIETIFATNHVGGSLLYFALLPLIRAASAQRGSARVVLVSSDSHCDTYPYGVATSLQQLRAGSGLRPFFREWGQLYGQSKLAQILFAQEAAERLARAGDRAVLVNACHPGTVDTGIWEGVLPILGGGPLARAARAAVRLAQRWVMWPAEEGALTQLYLAAGSEALLASGASGRYFVPQAREAWPCAHAANRTLQAAVWEFTEELSQF